MKHNIVICIKHSVQERQPDDNQARNNENETANMHMTDTIVNYGATTQITSHTRQLLDTRRPQTQRCAERLQLCFLLDLCKTKCARTCCENPASNGNCGATRPRAHTGCPLNLVEMSGRPMIPTAAGKIIGENQAHAASPLDFVNISSENGNTNNNSNIKYKY